MRPLTLVSYAIASLLLALPSTARGQILRQPRDPASCRHEPLRSTVIGASLGAAFSAGYVVIRDRDHRLSRDEYLPYAWATYSTAFLAGAVARMLAVQRCPTVATTFVIPDSLRGPRLAA